jgi:hypothetical protein
MSTFKKQTPPWESKSLLSMIKVASSIHARLVQSDPGIYDEDGHICLGCVAGTLEANWPAGYRRPKERQWLALAAIIVGFFKWQNDSGRRGGAAGLISQHHSLGANRGRLGSPGAPVTKH